MNWHMNGTGTVAVRETPQSLDFDETITLSNGRIAHDKKRWRFSGSQLYFDRFRNGDYEQIFEFAYQNGEWVLQKHYWCDPDDYHASLQIEPQLIVFTIYVHSSRKNECLRYEYVAK